MPRQTSIPNLGPTEQGFQLADATASTPGSLIAVSCSSQPGSTADTWRVTTSAHQVTLDGRPLLVDGKRVTIPDAVEEFPKSGNLYTEMQGEMMAHATRFESAGVAVPQTPPAPPAPTT